MPDETDHRIGFGLGLTRDEVDRAGRQHVEFWSARPRVKRTAAEWQLAFHAHLRTLAEDPKARRALKHFGAETVTAPADVDGPQWWRELAARLAEAHPAHWRSYWSQCEALSDEVELVCNGGPTALEWLQTDGLRQLRGMKLGAVRIVGPAAKIPVGIRIAASA